MRNAGGEGIAADWPGGVMAFLKSSPELTLPDIQLLFSAAPTTAHPYFPPFVKPYLKSYSMKGCSSLGGLGVAVLLEIGKKKKSNEGFALIDAVDQRKRDVVRVRP